MESLKSGSARQELKRVFLARALANFYGYDPDGPPRTCACTGLLCQNLKCVTWWECFLSLTECTIRKMMPRRLVERYWEETDLEKSRECFAEVVDEQVQ